MGGEGGGLLGGGDLRLRRMGVGTAEGVGVVAGAVAGAVQQRAEMAVVPIWAVQAKAVA